METQTVLPILHVNNRRGVLSRDTSTASEDTPFRKNSHPPQHLLVRKRTRSSSLDLRRAVIFRETHNDTMHKVSLNLLKAAGLRPQFPNILSRRGTLIDSNGTSWDRRFSYTFSDKIPSSTGSRDAGSLLVELGETDETFTSFSVNGQCSVSKEKRQAEAQKNIVRNKRKLFVQRKKICDFCLGFASVGFVSMIMEAELTSIEKTGISKVILNRR